jgi:hypothetical protein
MQKRKRFRPKLDETRRAAKRLKVDQLGQGSLTLEGTAFQHEGSLLDIVHEKPSLRHKKRKVGNQMPDFASLYKGEA